MRLIIHMQLLAKAQNVCFGPPTILDRGAKWNPTDVNKCASAVFGRVGAMAVPFFVPM